MTQQDGYNPQKPFTLPAGATEIVLVRHGSSAKAVEGAPFPLIEGRGNPPLADGIIGEICRQTTGSRPFAFIHSDNGAISRLVVMPGGRLLLRSFNDTNHLPVLTGPAG